MTVRRTAAEWEKIVEEYKKSGQTMAAWSKEHGISVKTLGNHVHEGEYPRSKRSLDKWAILIEQQQSSSLERTTWCKKYGISERAMRNAENRLKQNAGITQWVELESGSGIGPEAESLSKKEGDGIRGEVAESTRKEAGRPERAAAPYGGGESGKADTDEARESMPQGRHRVELGSGAQRFGEDGGSVRIRGDGLEVEISADYPVEKLATLIGKLVR